MLNDRQLAQMLDRDNGALICNQGSLRGGSVQPVSIDLTLGTQGLKWKDNLPPDFVIDPGMDPTPYMESVRIPPKYGGGYIIPAGGFLLAEIDQIIDLDNMHAAFIHGVSGIGRLSLFVQNAGLVDPLWYGKLTGELFNCAPYPFRIWAGLRIAQLTVERLDSPVFNGYGDPRRSSKYQGDMTVAASRAFKDEQ